MKPAAAFFLIGTVILSVWHHFSSYEVLLSLAITFGTISYHLIIRLLAALVIRLAMNNHADCKKRRYQVGMREMALYQKLKVKKWKGKLPTYDRASFDPQRHTWEEIAQATCQSELIHETNVVLSFLPIAAGFRFGAMPVFVVTSVLAALFDAAFVMMQRYNRQRMMRLLNAQNLTDEKRQTSDAGQPENTKPTPTPGR